MSRGGGLDGVVAAAVRGPEPGLVGAGPAGGDLHPVGHHEGGVEADAELADQGGAFLGAGALEIGGEGAGAGFGYSAQVLGQLVPRHADAVIGDGERPGGLVRGDADAGFAGQGQSRVGERLEAAAIGRVGGVGDQLAQEDLALGVEGMDDQIEQAANLGAEVVAFHRRLRAMGLVFDVGVIGHCRPAVAALAHGRGHREPGGDMRL